MITVQNLRITEHEDADLVQRENFSTYEAYQIAKAMARDFLTIRGECWVGGDSQKKNMQFEYKICKLSARDHLSEARKFALQNCLAKLADSLLENNGDKI